MWRLLICIHQLSLSHSSGTSLPFGPKGPTAHSITGLLKPKNPLRSLKERNVKFPSFQSHVIETFMLQGSGC